MIEIKTTSSLVPGDVVIDQGLEFQVEQIIRLRKRSQLLFKTGEPGQEKHFSLSSPNTKEWRVTK